MLTIKSDDVVGRAKAFEAIVKGTSIPTPKVPESFKVLIKELQALGLNVIPMGAKVIEESIMTEPISKAIAEEKIEKTALELERELGGEKLVADSNRGEMHMARSGPEGESQNE